MAGPGNVHNAYKFETNDHHEELGLNLADFNARQYDYQIGRFTSIDPMADAAGQEGLSPYHFAANDPANFVDPWGLGDDDNTNIAFTVNLTEVTVVGQRMHNDGSLTISLWWNSPPDQTSSIRNRPPNVHGSAGGGSDGGTPANTQVSIDPVALARAVPLQLSITPSPIPFVATGTLSSSSSLSLADLPQSDNLDAMFNLAVLSNASTSGSHLDGNSGGGWYSFAGKGNWAFGAGAIAAENLSGISRIGNNFKFYAATQAGRVFMGNQYVKTFSLEAAGGILGKASFLTGVLLDLRGVSIYYSNPNSPDAVSPAKAASNTTISAYGLTGVGTVPVMLYFGLESFYPGGFLGAMNDNSNIVQQSRTVVPYYRITIPGE